MHHRDPPPEQTVDGLAAIYAQLYPGVVRFAYVLTGSLELAEDLTQDVFSRVGERVGDLDAPEPYVRAAVVNAVRSSHRRQVVAERWLQSTAADESQLDDRELVELSDALAKLSMRRRTAVVLRYLYRAPDEEIAAALGCRRSTVRSLVRRGLEQLREEIG